MANRALPLVKSMVLAVMDGRKKQTRRTEKRQPPEHVGPIMTGFYNPSVVGRGGIEEPGPEVFGAWSECGEWGIKAPYAPGDRLWVRETARVISYAADFALVRYESDGTEAIVPWPDRLKPVDVGSCIPNGCHREAARTWLDVSTVGFERLQDISDSDAIAEGTPGGHGSIPGYGYAATPVEHYRHLWQSLNGPSSWEANPLVWVIEFKRGITPAEEK